MSELMKKSIFIETIIKYRPYFQVALVQRDSYSSSYYKSPSDFESVLKVEEPIKNSEIFRKIDIPMPLLNVGDDFYFEDTKEIVKVEKVIRTSEDNVVYVIKSKLVADDEMLAKYENDKEKYYADRGLRINIEELKSEIEKLKNRGLWARIFNKKD